MARYSRSWNVQGRKVTFGHRTPDEPMGRFGGGWQWSLGFEAGGNTIIFNLLVCSVRIDRRKSMRVPPNRLGVEELKSKRVYRA